MELYRIPEKKVTSFMYKLLHVYRLELSRNWNGDDYYAVAYSDQIDPGPVLALCDAKLLHQCVQEGFDYKIDAGFRWRRYCLHEGWRIKVCGIPYEVALKIYPEFNNYRTTLYWDPEKTIEENLRHK